MSGRGVGAIKTWEHSLRERCAELEHQGADKGITGQARQLIRNGELIEAEEALGHAELYLKAFLQVPR